jgi:hypothetical protein
VRTVFSKTNHFVELFAVYMNKIKVFSGSENKKGTVEVPRG